MKLIKLDEKLIKLDEHMIDFLHNLIPIEESSSQFCGNHAVCTI